MEPHELVDKTMERGDAERMASLFGKSAEWWNSHRRQPKTTDYQHGNGNKSPVAYYIEYVRKRFAANPRSAKRLHRAVNTEVETTFQAAEEVTAFSAQEATCNLSVEFAQAIKAINECHIDEATDDDLLRWDSEAGDLEEKAACIRAQIRAVRRRRQAQKERFRVRA